MTAAPRSAVRTDPAGLGAGGREGARKAIHLGASVAVALIAALAPPTLGRLLLLAAVALAAGIEWLRIHSPAADVAFRRAVGPLLRNRERRGVTGATTLAAGFAATMILVPQPFAAAGILMAGAGDAAGALIGRRWGRHHFPGGKSLEGSLACFSAALAAGAAMPGIGAAALPAALATAAFEAAPLPFDDNLLLPLLSAAAIWSLTVMI